MAESVHNEVVKITLQDQQFMSQISNMGKKSKAMFRQINADFQTLSSSGDWVKAYSQKVTGLEKLIQDSKKNAADLRKQLSSETINTSGYDKIATQLSKANSETARYEQALSKARLGMDRAKTGVMDLRNEVAMSERTMQSQVTALNAQGRSMTADTVKVSGYREQVQLLGSQLQAEQRYLKVIESQLGATSNEYREQAAVINETKARIAEYTSAQKAAYSNVGNMSAKFATASDSLKNFSSRNIEAGRAMTAAGSNMMITSFGIGAAFVSATKSAIVLEQSYKENTNLIKKNAIAEQQGAETTIASMTKKLAADQAGHASDKIINEDKAQLRKANANLAESQVSLNNAQAQSNKMMASGRSLSIEYGVSQQKIAEGYQELIKTGFTASQAMAAMPPILQASRATGEDFNRVLDVTVQTMNQFSDSTGRIKTGVNSYVEGVGKAKYTTNVLAAAANASSTSYSTLGEAMAQVGPVMSELGFTMSDTAAIVGVLSNRGLDGAQAGNNLKRAWMQLTSGSSQTQAAIKQLGLQIYDANGKTKSMSDIMSQLKDKMANMSQGDKEIIMKKLFGAYARTAGSILTDNAVAIDEVAAATRNAGDSGNYVSDLAKKNMKTASAQIDRFKAAITELGMSFARELLPSITKIASSATNVVDGLSQMSPWMKKMIVYALAAVAALGPLGILIGGLRTSIGFAVMPLTKLVTIIGKIKGASSAGANGINLIEKAALGANGTMTRTGTAATVMGSNIGRAGGGFATMAVQMGSAGAKTGKFGSAMRVASSAVGGLIGIPLGPWGLAAGVGIAAVTALAIKFGPAIHTANRQLSEYGTTLTASQEKSVKAIQNFHNSIEVELSGTTKSVEANTGKIASAFSQEALKVKKANDKEIKSLKEKKKALKDQGYDTSGLDKQISYYKTTTKMAEQAAQTAINIDKGVHDSKRKLTDGDVVMLSNASKEITTAQIRNAKLSKDQRSAIEKELSGEFKNLTNVQLADMNKSYVSALANTKGFKTQLDAVKTANEGLSKSAKKDNWTTFVKNNVGALTPIWENYRQQLSQTQKGTAEYATVQAGFRAELEKLGIPAGVFEKVMKQMAKTASTSVDGLVDTTKKMSDSTQKAGDTWNNLIFDPKTGKISTNAVEEIAKAKKGSKTWNSINLLLKKGKMDFEGQELISQAIQSTNAWNKLNPKEQILIAKVTGQDDILDALEKFKVWNSLTPEQKTAVANAKGVDEVWTAIGGFDKWNSSSPKQQYAIVQSLGGKGLQNSIGSFKNWNSLPEEVKNAVANDLASGNAKKAKQAVDNYSKTNNPKPIDLKATDKTKPTIDTAKLNVGTFTGSNGNKDLTARDLTGMPVLGAKNQVSGYMVMPANKGLYANNQNYTPVLNAKGQVTGYMNTNANKPISANNQNYGPITDAKGNVTGYMKMNSTKDIKAHDHASSVMQDVLSWMGKFHDINFTITSHSRKKAKGTQNFEGGLATVNDQQGGLFREMIQLPTGDTFIPQGRNVTLPLPAHSRVFTASKTRSMLGNIPQFANGLNDSVSSTTLMRDINRTAKSVNTIPVVKATSSGDTMAIAQLTNQVNDLSAVVGKLATVIASQNSKEAVLVLNDQVIMKEFAPLVDKAQSTLNYRNARLRGNR